MVVIMPLIVPKCLARGRGRPLRSGDTLGVELGRPDRTQFLQVLAQVAQQLPALLSPPRRPAPRRQKVRGMRVYPLSPASDFLRPDPVPLPGWTPGGRNITQLVGTTVKRYNNELGRWAKGLLIRRGNLMTFNPGRIRYSYSRESIRFWKSTQKVMFGVPGQQRRYIR